VGVKKLLDAVYKLFGSGVKADVEIIELRGIKIPLDRSIISPTVERAMLNGEYEASEASNIGTIIGNNERVLELGVGVGFLSCLILKNPLVEAYLGLEAHPALPKLIRQVFELNGVEGEIREGVVTADSTEEFVEFYLRDDYWVSSKMPCAQDSDTRPIKVKCLNLSELIREFRPTLIVCDTEGSELELFTGTDLGGVSKVYLEVHEEVIGPEGIAELCSHFEQSGLSPVPSESKGDVLFFARP